MQSNQIEQPEAQVVELFVWKWAANDVRGDIHSILCSLHAGYPHSALTTFEAESVIERLETTLTGIRQDSPGLVTRLKELKHGDPAIAILVSLVGCCNVLKAMQAIGSAMTAIGLCGCTAHERLLLPGCLPKHSRMLLDSERVSVLPLYDPSLTDVLEALGRVDVLRGICYGILEAASGNYVQVYGYYGKYYVEWRTLYDRTWLKYVHTAAGRQPRSSKHVWLGDHGHYITAFEHELLERADVERIFTAFYRGEKRPRDYAWRRVFESMTSEGVSLRYRIEGAGSGEGSP